MLEEGWNNMEKDLVAQLVDSMPRKCQAVIDAGSYATKYKVVFSHHIAVNPKILINTSVF